MKKTGILGKNFDSGSAEFSDGRKVSDKQVADLVMKHTTLFDKIFNPRKIAVAAQYAFLILSGSMDEPKHKNWKF